MGSGRSLELMEPKEIEQLLSTILDVSYFWDLKPKVFNIESFTYVHSSELEDNIARS